jgi:hypothetical protein
MKKEKVKIVKWIAKNRIRKGIDFSCVERR